MNRKNAGIAFALCLLAGRTVYADDDATVAKTNCIANWTTLCSKECATSKCVSNCTTQAHDECAKDITAPQKSFSGPVTSTPTNDCEAPPAPACTPALQITTDSSVDTATASCSIVSGTVANKAFWGGDVTIYVICPPFTPAGHQNADNTTTVVGTARSSCIDGTFTITATNACGGETGCYGLIAATPAGSCETCGNCSATVGDPTWSSCTSTTCPSP